jgi:hypothetical protein
MERSRFRSLLGLALLIIGVVLFSSQLVRSFVFAPAPPPMPVARVMPDLPAMPALPPLPAMPPLPALPAAPALPPLPALPDLPPVPPAPIMHPGFRLSPAMLALGIVLLLIWRRRGHHEQQTI